MEVFYLNKKGKLEHIIVENLLFFYSKKKEKKIVIFEIQLKKTIDNNPTIMDMSTQ